MHPQVEPLGEGNGLRSEGRLGGRLLFVIGIVGLGNARAKSRPGKILKNHENIKIFERLNHAKTP